MGAPAFLVGGCWGGGPPGGWGGRPPASIGILMNTRGLMELIVLNIGMDLRVISPTLFAMLVMMALVTTFATTPILDALSPRGYRPGSESAAGRDGHRSRPGARLWFPFHACEYEGRRFSARGPRGSAGDL